MFACRFEEFFGAGETPMEAFEDMVEVMTEGDIPQDICDTVDPHRCEFFEQIEVEICSKTTWSIELVSDFDIDE